MLDGLRHKLGAKHGTQAYEDLRGRNDPETPTTTSKSFAVADDVQCRQAARAW